MKKRQSSIRSRSASLDSFSSNVAKSFSKSFRAKSKKHISVQKYVQGELTLNRHTNGYPLAQAKVLKPVDIKPTLMPLYDCKVVDKELRVTYKITTCGASETNQSATMPRKPEVPGKSGSTLFRTTQRRRRKSGGGHLKLDNNYLRIERHSKKSSGSAGGKSKSNTGWKFSIMHLYAIEKQQTAKKDEFTLIFYSGTDEDFAKGTALESTSFELVSVTLRVRNGLDSANEVLGHVYTALRGQAFICRETGMMLQKRKSELLPGHANSVDFFRLSVDLFALCGGCLNQDTLEAMSKLIRCLEEDHCQVEALFWLNRKRQLEVELEEEAVSGNAVAGVLI